MDPNICRERILSEDYRDFVVTETVPLPLSKIPEDQLCQQRGDFDYRCIYASAIQADPVNLERYTYLSIPKCYSLLSMEALNQAGILAIQNYPTLQLKGNNVMIGFLDTGIDYENSIFRGLDGSTRIAGIWDQTIQTGAPPENFAYGTEYTREMINEALQSEDPKSRVPSVDEIGHGTFLASLAAGSGNPEEQFLGAAPECTIAVVKLKQAKQYLRDYYFVPASAPCYQDTDILLGLRYLNELAAAQNMPLVLCIALGTSLGGHTSLTPLSQVLERYSTLNSRIPVIGGGNEADQRHHYSYELRSGASANSVEIRVGENVPGFVMELWADIPNVLSITLTSPSGETTTPVIVENNAASEYNFVFERTQVTVNYRLIVERSTSELAFFSFRSPVPGIWKVNITPVQTIDGQFHIWLPVKEFIEGEVYFLNADPYYTLTNPGNTISTLVVSYYDGANNSIALSSGRGYTRYEQLNPDLTAPGINVMGALPGGRYAVRSGSSVSTGISAGATALLVEWIIYQLGNPRIDSYQIKSLLILGAVRPPNMTFPNREWGYGQLNLYNTFEQARRF